MMHRVNSSSFSSSRLCGESAGFKKSRVNTRRITAEALLAQGARGGISSPHSLRHGEIMHREAVLFEAADRFADAPQKLHQVLSREARNGTPAEKLAENRLADVLLTGVRRKFLETALAQPKSEMRAERLTNLKAEVDGAKPFHGRLSRDMREQLRQFQVDSDALAAICRAQTLQKEAHANADEMAKLVFPSSLHPPRESEEARPMRRQTSSCTLACEEGSERSDIHYRDAALERAHQQILRRELELEQQRARIVKEAMDMLRTWKSHSQVAHALCDALLSMTEIGGEAFKEEMEKGGLAVMASTVADLHRDRCEVARCAMRLLSTISIELLVATVEEQSGSDAIVGLGLEALNRIVKDNVYALEELAKYGGREMLEDLEDVWKGSRMISLHILNLRRRLRRSTTKSIKKRLLPDLPPDDVVKLREIFEEIDEQKSGHIGSEQLGLAFAKLGIQFDERDLEGAVKEVDLDGSGFLEWPEFLFLMSKFGTNFSIENQFSKERLAEMKEVFDMFDEDSSGTLDVSELRTVMRSIGLAPQDWEIRAMIAEVDSTGSGQIDRSEFLYLMSKKTADAENQHKIAFEFFLEPNNRTGKIGKDRFVSQMQRLTSEFSTEELEAMIVQSKFEDSDSNFLSYREFVKMMMKH